MNAIKNKITIFILLICAIGFFAFTTFQTGIIRGTVSPAEAGLRAWAIAGTDTFRTDINPKNGAYEIRNVKMGAYRVIIEAKKPYRNAAKDDVVVSDILPVDIGIIELVKDSVNH
ncbi:MAG: hypothetical protein V4722_01885 [Bacteroidota bacterium]